MTAWQLTERGLVVTQKPRPQQCLIADTSHGKLYAPMDLLPSTHQWQRIVNETAQKYQLPASEIIGARKFKPLIPARDEATARIQSEVRWLGKPPSTKQVGRWMGGRDHSTVIQAIQRHARTVAA